MWIGKEEEIMKFILLFPFFCISMSFIRKQKKKWSDEYENIFMSAKTNVRKSFWRGFSHVKGFAQVNFCVNIGFDKTFISPIQT